MPKPPLSFQTPESVMRLIKEWGETAPRGNEQITIRMPGDLVRLAKAFCGRRYPELLRAWLRAGASLDLLHREGEYAEYSVETWDPGHGKGKRYTVRLDYANEFWSTPFELQPFGPGCQSASVSLFIPRHSADAKAAPYLAAQLAPQLSKEVVNEFKKGGSDPVKLTVSLRRPVACLAQVEGETVGALMDLLSDISSKPGHFSKVISEKSQHGMHHAGSNT